jgi:hypothetical protein
MFGPRITRSLQLALVLLGCSRLPDSAAPKGGLVEAGSVDLSDAIPYRTLTRADFKGTKAPAPFAAVADRVGAATCGNVLTTPDTQLAIVGEGVQGGGMRYRVSVKQLRFLALMDRSCSWWNDGVAAFAPDYVLEHEQIHFALYELGARRLNASASDIARDMQNEGSSKEDVQREAEQTLRQAVLDEVETILAENREFDEDTSLGYKPERQKVWLAKVTSQLSATKQWARAPRPRALQASQTGDLLEMRITRIEHQSMLHRD